ncbi:MAG: YigZ family protein [Eubacterium sp.]|nr:YigZ family protein [Eubacterium sp.]
MGKVEKILSRGGSGEYSEKRSRFIAELIPVKTETEVTEHIERIRKKYYDARHNCYAYRVITRDVGLAAEPARSGNSQSAAGILSGDKTDSGGLGEIIERSSDDGEPSGTAGRPMMDILIGEELINVLAVVTRYYGGVNLGTGGLVRAYGAAVKDAIENSVLTEVKPGKMVVLNTDYTNLSTVQHRLRECAAIEYGSEYGDDVKLDIIIPEDRYESFLSQMSGLFMGKERLEFIRDVRYGVSDGRSIIL